MIQIVEAGTKISRAARRFLGRFRASSQGNIAVMSALILPVVLGVFGLGTETSSWYLTQRGAQNAADSAAIAAATNSGSDFVSEAKAVSAQYGFVDGQGGVKVTATNGETCPSGDTNCYKVVVAKSLPLMLAQVVGFHGDSTVGGSPAKTVTATALAVQAIAPRPYCVLALASSGASPALRTNGAPKADLAGCNVMSNTAADCNGHNLGADVGDAHGNNDGCGVKQNSNVAALPDPYSGLASQVPSNPCSSYPQEPSKKADPSLPAINQLAGGQPWGPTPVTFCGDVQLTGPVVINSSGAGAVMVIENGQLDTNGYSITTSAGSAVTIIFSGTPGAGYTHGPTGGGTLDIAAPTTGPWSGVAVYQDPKLTQGVDISEAGNTPTWDITGLVYLPHSAVKFSGAVNKASNGKACFVMVVDTLLINGTADILPKGQCAAAGLSMPASPQPSRGKLVS